MEGVRSPSIYYTTTTTRCSITALCGSSEADKIDDVAVARLFRAMDWLRDPQWSSWASDVHTSTT